MTRSKRILIYKICCAVFAVVILFLPHYGLPYTDIRVLATVIGIDGGIGDVTLSAQLAVPVAQDGDGKASTVACAKGGSVSEALENLELGLGRRIDYGHLSTVAIGKDMKLDDLREHINYLMSSGKMGPGAYLVYCSETPAYEFMEEAQELGESSDAEISNFITFSKRGNHVSTTTALKFLQSLNSTSHASIMPCVSVYEEDTGHKEGEESGGESEGGEQSGGSGESGGEQSGGQSKSKKLISVESIAVFGGDEEKALILDARTTSGVVWQDKNSDFGLVELRNVLIDGEEVPSVSARLTKKKVSKSVKVENGETVLTYKIKARLRLDDSRICGNPMFYDKWKNALEKEFESVIKNNLMLAVKSSKEHNVDYLGLKETFHKFCKAGYDKFELADSVVNVEAKVNIQT